VWHFSYWGGNRAEAEPGPASALVPLQGLAKQYSARVTFISGDVHVGAFGCFQAHPKEYNKVVDHKFMLQVRIYRYQRSTKHIYSNLPTDCGARNHNSYCELNALPRSLAITNEAIVG
jgi:hypothetical protein